MPLRHYIQKHERTLGTAGSVLAILMFVSLVEVALSNFKGESAIIVQPAMVCLSGVVWSLYAYARRDWYLFLPNALAVLLGALTVTSALV